MCGIFGLVVSEGSSLTKRAAHQALDGLFRLSQMRGKESAGVAIHDITRQKIGVYKASVPATKFIQLEGYHTIRYRCLDSNYKAEKTEPYAAIGHARLVTNGSKDDNRNNQPVVKSGVVGVHNGIVCNIDDLWETDVEQDRIYEVDTEWLMKSLKKASQSQVDLGKAYGTVYHQIEGTASTAVLDEANHQLVLATNCGSLYYLSDATGKAILFASEKMILSDLLQIKNMGKILGNPSITRIEPGEAVVIDIKTGAITPFTIGEANNAVYQPVEELSTIVDQSSFASLTGTPINTGPEAAYKALMEYNLEEISALKRCTTCLLPETFPFIDYDEKGECNYCKNYQKLQFAGEDVLLAQLDQYRKKDGSPDCIVTLSGGRDSCYVLHKFVEEYNMNPIAYTYDWGMVTDLARRNQARMCGALGVEHIVISADITTKRSNIRKNVNAWLRRPQLGTIPLFMAGDKQYFYYANMLKKKYNIELVVMGENMLETTNFKSGFCGIKPKFGTENTFTLKAGDKLKMLWYYGKAYLRNPKYLNSSMRDTLHAFFTYYFMNKENLNLFDFIQWDEETVNSVLLEQYNWELSPDTTTTWRIGDGTAAFYNYIYYNVAGFSEFDTFRSNQIREGVLSRDEALQLVNQENQPRYESFKWYCDTIGLDFETTVKTINNIPKKYRNKKS